MKTKTIAIGLVAVVIALIGLRATLFAPRPDDQQLIRQAIADSVRASKEGRPGGVLELLSDRFRLNEMNPNSRDIARVIRENKPDVTVMNDTAQVLGDEARIVSPVEISANFLGTKISRTMNDVTLRFQRESARKWLVFPTQKWRLVEVSAPEEAIREFSGL